MTSLSQVFTPQSRKLLLMRHAEADWGLDDFNRPLTRRGHQQAGSAGQWLRSCGLIPEMVLASSALRTRQTVTWLADALGQKAPTASLDERLYNADADQLLQVIAGVPDSVQSLLLVAHLPGVQELALDLMHPQSDREATVEVSYGFPPATIASFEVGDAWSNVRSGQQLLRALEIFAGGR
ncbi:MAG: histidine phosphatase family protein [Rothia sp. (in: high G+C Gram-positive bacteria)]|nr:histidine phosphatase family protein [Rothia sp. (in: high G+C Gram-positive bacteria)]